MSQGQSKSPEPTLEERVALLERRLAMVARTLLRLTKSVKGEEVQDEGGFLDPQALPPKDQKDVSDQQDFWEEYEEITDD